VASKWPLMVLAEVKPRLLWVLFACVPATAKLGGGRDASAMQPAHGTAQEAQLCLSRVAPLAKAEGYGELCTSIEALYREQQNSAASLLALREEGEHSRASYSVLEQRNQELEERIQQLQQHEITRETTWQHAAKKFQADVASRDAQWQSTVSHIETAATKKFEEGLRDRDAHWQATVRNIEAEKSAAEQIAVDARKQKEAMEASTSVGTQSRRAILLALSQEKSKSHSESKEVQGLLEQIKLLQAENAQLVQRCVAGNS